MKKTPRAPTRRARASRRSRGASDGMALLRLGVAASCVAVLVSTVPPLRRAYLSLRNTLAVALEVSRASDARRLEIGRYALRYGISFELASSIERSARAEGIDPELAFRLVQVESEFRERAVSPAGALGLTQLMPATAESLRPGITREEIFERDTNLRLGFRYLRWLLRTYDGRVDDALHAYNRGPGRVDRIRAAGGDPANGYADRILRRGGAEPYRGDGLVE